MIAANETFDGTWPYAPHFFDGNGFRQHYVDDGPRDTGETFLCLHGEPTWGYLYRHFVEPLSTLGRVVVPDHMGFGKSETPQDRSYSIREHYENLERLLLHLDLRDVTLVMQDWGGPIGSQFAYRHPDRVKRLVVMNTFAGGQAPAGTPQVADYPWFQWVQSDQFEPTIMNLGATVLSVMKRIGFERLAHVDETWVRAYAAPFPTPADCVGARAFPRNIADPETMKFVLEGVTAAGAVEAVRAKSAMLVTGAEDRAMPCEMVVGSFRDMWPDAPVSVLPGVGHFIQEDAPEQVTALILQFVQMT
ncbi:MAG: alpha/beta fold hydrolase [Gemmatimonadota bacterium]|jgi:haloalkane dehalogenase